MGITKLERKPLTTARQDRKAMKTDITENKQGAQHSGQFERLFGFQAADLTSLERFLRLLCRPTDPAGLGVMRIVFGTLMLVDIWQERGLSMLSEEYGSTELCRFPLFNFLAPLPLEWMYMVYLVMFIGEVGILLGLFYRASCVLFLIPYWYLFFLDKMSWNNHSYLFGLTGVLLLLTDANRFWSIDGWLSKRKCHAHVPLWNYAIFRFQLFIVYFIAGLKKLDLDWVSGYSMNTIAGHFVFAPFRLLISEEQVSLYIVHLGGLTIDLCMGFCLFFDKTRPLAFLFGASFHLMNSQLFSIGMFPWMMLATLPLFCYPDWPRVWLARLPNVLSPILPTAIDVQTSSHCVYDKRQIKPDEKQKSSRHQASSNNSSSSPPPTRLTVYHKLMTGILALYITSQCLLPYSHGITKGYNHWTQGLYGYSWDMMVHSWRLQHVKVTYVDKITGQEGYLNPQIWTSGGRWSSHPDMIKQYAECVRSKLEAHNIGDIQLHIDIWRALNDRFQQRTVDPRVDILDAPWSPFRDTPWLLPLLADLSDWREKLADIERDIFAQDSFTDVVFVADFPGLYLENFVQEDLGNTSITVLKGHVIVEFVDQGKNFSLSEGDKIQVPVLEFHNVHTVSDTPSCYMYVYVNTKDVEMQQKINQYEQIQNNTFTGTEVEANRIKFEIERGDNAELFKQLMSERVAVQEKDTMSLSQQWKMFVDNKLHMLSRSIKFTFGAMRSIITGESFDKFLNATYNEELAQRKQMEQYKVF